MGGHDRMHTFNCKPFQTSLSNLYTKKNKTSWRRRFTIISYTMHEAVSLKTNYRAFIYHPHKNDQFENMFQTLTEMDKKQKNTHENKLWHKRTNEQITN